MERQKTSLCYVYELQSDTVNVKRKPNKVIKQPLNITTYNNYMGGVDKADATQAKVTSYTIALKKWHHTD